MKIEAYTQQSGGFFLLSPPCYADFAAFYYCLKFIKGWEKQEWFNVDHSQQFLFNLPKPNSVSEFLYSNILSSFCSLFVYQVFSEDKIDHYSLTVDDLKRLVEISDKLIALNPLPKIPTSKNNVKITIQSTGDDYSDLLGDLINRFGLDAVNLCKQFDYGTIQQILNRTAQWSYWQNPDNIKKQEEKEEKRQAKQRLRKAAIKRAKTANFDNLDRKTFNFNEL